MSISVRCSECDEVCRVSDEKAGKKIRCKQCGAVNLVVDDLEVIDETPVRRVSGDRQRRRTTRAAKQPPWMAISGASAAVLLLVLIVVFLRGTSSSSSREWVSDPVGVAMLDREVNLNGYAIRPPRGWTVSYNEERQGAPTVTYIWYSPDSRETLTLEFRQDARYQPDYEPHVYSKGKINMVDGSRDNFMMPEAIQERGTINGQKYLRLFIPQAASRLGGASAYYLAYFQGLGVKVTISSRHGETSAAFKALEAAALSFRIGSPSDPSAVPVQQLLAPKES